MSEKLEPGDVDWLCDWMQPERLGWHNRERFKRILTALSAVPGRIDLEAFSSVAGLADANSALPVCLDGDATPSDEEAAIRTAYANCAEWPERAMGLTPDQVNETFMALLQCRNAIPFMLGRWRPEVRAFADLMERELQANDHKGGWSGEQPVPLLKRLFEEAEELAEALRSGSRTGIDTWRQRIGSEAADVANFAMMVADVCGALAVPEGADDLPVPCYSCGGHNDIEQLRCEVCGGVGLLGNAPPEGIASTPDDTREASKPKARATELNPSISDVKPPVVGESWDPQCSHCASRYSTRWEKAEHEWLVHGVPRTGPLPVFGGAQICGKDRQPCYIGADTDDAHWRCGTVQCGLATPSPREAGLREALEAAEYELERGGLSEGLAKVRQALSVQRESGEL